MAFLCPQLLGSILSLGQGQRRGGSLQCAAALRGILVHPDFFVPIAGGSSYHTRAAEQQLRAVSPAATPNVTQNSVPKGLPASTCRAQRAVSRFGRKEATIPFLPKDPCSLEVGRFQFYWCGCERRGGPSQPPPLSSQCPWSHQIATGGCILTSCLSPSWFSLCQQ